MHPKHVPQKHKQDTAIPFEMGSKYFVNNVNSTPVVGLDIADNIIQLYDGRLDSAQKPHRESNW